MLKLNSQLLQLNYNLRMRFDQDLSYCYCGNTCVAINLFYQNKPQRDKDGKQLWRESDWEDRPHEGGYKANEVIDAFSVETQGKYIGSGRDKNPPHVYAVAEAAFQALFHGNIMVRGVV